MNPEFFCFWFFVPLALFLKQSPHTLQFQTKKMGKISASKNFEEGDKSEQEEEWEEVFSVEHFVSIGTRFRLLFPPDLFFHSRRGS